MKYPTQKVPPLKAIRWRCRDCGDPSGCARTTCALWRYRLGKMPKEQPKSPMRAIRAYCLWCCCGIAAEVRVCHPLDCVLRCYRFGKNPSLAGKGKKIEVTEAV